MLQFRGRVNLLCRSDHSWIRLKKFAICMYIFFHIQSLENVIKFISISNAVKLVEHTCVTDFFADMPLNVDTVSADSSV